MTELLVRVEVSDRRYDFAFQVHATTDNASRLIEDNFYLLRSPSGELPEGLHHEIEVVGDLVAKWPNGKHEKVHLHRSEKLPEKNLLCWTQPIEDLEKAIVVATLWAAGTVYTLEEGPSFASLIDLRLGITTPELKSRLGVIEGYGPKIAQVVRR